MKKSNTIKSIANEWTSFAKANFYCTWSPENQDYSPISNANWDTFGEIMAVLTEGLEDPMPSGTEDRLYYRTYAAITTGGIDYAKQMHIPEYVITSFMEAVHKSLEREGLLPTLYSIN